MAVALEREARRLLTRASGEFERLALEQACKLAAEQNRSTIDVELMKLAIESFAPDNSVLRQTMNSGECTSHVERRAG